MTALPRRSKVFHLSAFQARVFNRVLAARMGWPGGATRVVPGDLILDPWNGTGVPVRGEAQAAAQQVAAGSLEQVPNIVIFQLQIQVNHVLIQMSVKTIVKLLRVHLIKQRLWGNVMDMKYSLVSENLKVDFYRRLCVIN